MRLSRRFWLGLLLLAAFALRLYRLGVTSLWYDETVSTFLAQQDLGELTRHTAGDIHPPLYYYLLRFWGQLAGWSEFSMAFASLFFGVLLIALVYRVAREWCNENIALIAMFLVAISPYNLWYSQEVRMYTIGATLGLASVYFFVRMLASRRSTAVSRQKLLSRDLVAYAIVSALGMYTLYYFAFLIVFENLVAVVWLFRNLQFAIRNLDLRITNHSLRIWLFSQLAVLFLYLPWVFNAFRQATNPPVPPWRTFTDLPRVLIESFSALALGQSVDWAAVSFVPLVLLIVAAVIIVALWRNVQPSPVGGLFLLSYTFVPLLVIYALSLWKPLYHVRYIFTYSPAFYILLALGLERIRNSQFTIRNSRIAFYILLVLIAVASSYSAYNFWSAPKYTKDDLRGAVNYIAERWRPGDAVLIDAGYTYTAFVYYYHQPIAWRGRLTDYTSRDATAGAVVLQTGSIGGSSNLGWGDPRSDFYATTADETRAALDQVFASHSRVWLLRLYDTVVDPDGMVRNYLAQRGRIIDDQGFAGESFTRVQGYITSHESLTVPPLSAARRDTSLGNRVTLLGFEPVSATVRAGAPLDVNVYWQAQEPTNIDERLYVGLFAADGKLAAASEELPLGNALGTSRWLPGEILREPLRLNIPANAEPGDYVLRVMLYNPLTGEPLAAQPSEWVVENSQVKLTNVRVDK